MQTHKETLYREGDFDEWVYFNVRNFPHPVMEFIPWPIKVSGLIFSDGSEQWTAGGGGGTGQALLPGPGISLTPGLGTLTIGNTQMQTPWLSNVNAGGFGITNLSTINGVPVASLQQSPWVANVNGGGFTLSNVSGIAVGSGGLNVSGGINIVDPGGASGYRFTINGAPFTGTPAGANQQIQYNNAGVFGANANFTFDGAGDVRLHNATGNAEVLVTSGATANGWASLGLISNTSELAATCYGFPGINECNLNALNAPMSFSYNGLTCIYISPAGNVGIGAFSSGVLPGYRLTVLGDIDIQGSPAPVYRINGTPVTFRGGAHVDSNPPGSPDEGDFWFDDAGLKLYIRFSGTWVGI